MEVVKAKGEHLKYLVDKDEKCFLRECMTPELYASIDYIPNTYTLLIDGNPILCGGIREYWPNRGELWAVLDPDCKKHFVKIHRAVKRFLKICTIKRIEASVEFDFEAGHRWIKMLGFQLEAPRLKHFLPNGKDCSMYVRFN